MAKRITILIILIALILACQFGSAQNANSDFDLVSKSIRFPHKFKKWKFQSSLGFSMVKLPLDWVENSIQAPLVNFHGTLGMPAGFSFDVDFTTIIVSNQISIGPKWNFIHRNFSFNIGYDFSLSTGRMNFAGFDNKGLNLINYPNFSIGVKIKDVALTYKYEAVIVSLTTMKTGNNIITKDKNYFNGSTMALYLEQRLWKKRIFILGFKFSSLKYYWPAWMVFSTFDRFYNIPELYFGWGF